LPAIDPRAHHGAEGANVKEIVAHELPKFVGLYVVLRIERLVRHGLFVVRPDCDVGLPMLVVEDGAFLHIDRIAGIAALGDFSVVANFALEADIRDQTLVRLGIESRQISGVGVAIGIAVAHVEQEDEIVAMGKRGHASYSCGAAIAAPRAPSLRR
jgi:hypothetical protein